jgi:hypothetical protein
MPGGALAAAACEASERLVAAAAALAAGDTLAVDGVGNGPLSSWQPGDEHPVAAGPVKVGELVPRLDVVTVLAVLAAGVLADAAADPVETTASPSGNDNSDSAARVLRTIVLLGCISGLTVEGFPPTPGAGR